MVYPIDSLVVLGFSISRTFRRNCLMAFSGMSTLGTILPLVPMLLMIWYPKKLKPSVVWVTRLLYFAIAGVHVILSGPLPPPA
jgi:hypothetical protein